MCVQAIVYVGPHDKITQLRFFTFYLFSSMDVVSVLLALVIVLIVLGGRFILKKLCYTDPSPITRDPRPYNTQHVFSIEPVSQPIPAPVSTLTAGKYRTSM